MPCPTKRTTFGDYIFDICEEVYEPAEDTFLFAENLDVKECEQVLDVGTGCGLLGILAARRARSVVAVDLNPYAIRCAKQNSVLNGIQNNMSFIQASLFTALNPHATFDLILFNAPYLPSDENDSASWIGRAWAGGINGREVVDRFISEVASYLNPCGRVLLMQSTLTGVEETLQKFSEQGFKATIKAEQKLPFFETIILVEANAGFKKETIYSQKPTQ
jgi:release factor glutamine methyltransferase